MYNVHYLNFYNEYNLDVYRYYYANKSVPCITQKAAGKQGRKRQ